MASERFSLNKEDITKWIKNAAIFAAPAALIFLLQIQAGSTIEEAFIAIKVWGLNTAIDLLRKFIGRK